MCCYLTCSIVIAFAFIISFISSFIAQKHGICLCTFSPHVEKEEHAKVGQCLLKRQSAVPVFPALPGMLCKSQSEESDGTNLDAAAAKLNNPTVQTSPAIGLTCAPLVDGWMAGCAEWIWWEMHTVVLAWKMMSWQSGRLRLLLVRILPKQLCGAQLKNKK